jgi:hypothetical protein
MAVGHGTAHSWVRPVPAPGEIERSLTRRTDAVPPRQTLSFGRNTKRNILSAHDQVSSSSSASNQRDFAPGHLGLKWDAPLSSKFQKWTQRTMATGIVKWFNRTKTLWVHSVARGRIFAAQLPLAHGAGQVAAGNARSSQTYSFIALASPIEEQYRHEFAPRFALRILCR